MNKMSKCTWTRGWFSVTDLLNKVLVAVPQNYELASPSLPGHLSWSCPRNNNVHNFIHLYLLREDQSQIRDFCFHF